MSNTITKASDRDELPRVLVCGGRTYADYYRISDELDDLCHDRDWLTEPDRYGRRHPKVCIISGMAPGADRLAIQWAIARDCPWLEFRADWKKHGKSAGMIRNRQMLEEGKPVVVVAFPGGKGTANMVDIAQRAGVEVIIIEV